MPHLIAILPTQASTNGVWIAPVVILVGALVVALITWGTTRWWFKRRLALSEEKYLTALSKYESTKEAYNSLAYNNAALRSDRNRWEEEQAEMYEERDILQQQIAALQQQIAHLTEVETQ